MPKEGARFTGQKKGTQELRILANPYFCPNQRRDLGSKANLGLNNKRECPFKCYALIRSEDAVG